MKTPYEIKKGLECCAEISVCSECPYHNPDSYGGECVEDKSKDGLNYINQLENHIGELTEKVSQLEAAQPKWISVEERLPNAGEKVMIRGVKNGMQIGAFSGITRHGKNRRWWWKKNTILEVTHWMSLPEPPKEVNHD